MITREPTQGMSATSANHLEHPLRGASQSTIAAEITPSRTVGTKDVHAGGAAVPGVGGGAISFRGANDAHHWRQAKRLRYQTGLEPRPPVHVPG